jgi:hypothetical protein
MPLKRKDGNSRRLMPAVFTVKPRKITAGDKSVAAQKTPKIAFVKTPRLSLSLA